MQEISEDSIIIFITSYEHYIKDAFGINVFDYILKEECQAKLPSAISTILKKMNNKKERYCFKTHEGSRTFNLNDLISIELQYNRTLLMMTKRKEHILSSTSLTKLYRLIASPQICRPNSHHLVNMNYIDEIYKGEIRLKGIAKSIVISRGKYKEIYELYMNYLIEKEL
jgi:DNA-binding LytR/AlgR family response regulator